MIFWSWAFWIPSSVEDVWRPRINFKRRKLNCVDHKQLMLGSSASLFLSFTILVRTYCGLKYITALWSGQVKKLKIIGHDSTWKRNSAFFFLNEILCALIYLVYRLVFIQTTEATNDTIMELQRKERCWLVIRPLHCYCFRGGILMVPLV